MNSRGHRAILFALPWLIFLLNPNWTFQGFGNFDPFYYFGQFIHYPHYQRLQPTYAGERLAWVLPGYVLVHLLTPVYGTLVLHFLTYYVSVFALYAIVRRFAGAQAALLAACMLGCHPYFLAANGTDYVTGACIAYCLLTFYFLMRSATATSPALWVFAAGLSWAAVIYTYIFWVVFTPACLLVYWAAGGRKWLPTAGAFALGAATLTLVFMAHAGGLMFQPVSFSMAKVSALTQENPYASKYFSVTYADWLVFPGLTAALSIVYLIRRGLPRGADKLLLAYLYFFAVMVAMTVRGGLLQFDFMANMLLPGAFLVLGVTVFRETDQKWFWPVLVLACIISIAPLARPGLYVKPPSLGALPPAALLGAALAVSFWRRGVAILLLAAAAFCLRPEEGGLAWRGPGNWMAATRRVGETVQTIERRLPADKYPVFWYREAAAHGLEFQGVMCAFLSHGSSMRNFPEADRNYAPGQVVVLLTNERASRPSAMPLSVLWEQQISSGGDSYWITATEVKP